MFEAARTLGGRARRVEVGGRDLDNGQHILLGAYSESLRLMQRVGIAPSDVLLRLPLQMRYPAGSPGMQMIAPRLPAPLHLLIALLRARGLDREDKLALARFQTAARWAGWQLYNDCTVSELLERYDQTDNAIRLMWRPLCIAALNTPPERASAQVFLAVLKDSLGARRSASDMLLPKADLSALFPDRAAEYLQRNRGTIHLGQRVQRISRDAEVWLVDCGEQVPSRFDAVIVATSPWQAKMLIDPLAPGLVPEFEYESIATCYLQYPAGTSLPRSFFALVENADAGDWGQFVFDRGQLDQRADGLFAVVISTSSETPLNNDTLPAAVAAQLARAFGDQRLLAPEWSQPITEKRATFSCTPALQRPSNDTGVEGLWLAGDYTAGPYPATMESAVRSGVAAAQGLHQSISRTRVNA